MTIHLYQQNKETAFSLCRQTLLKLGFMIQFADDDKGMISSSKQMKSNGHFIFCDVRLIRNRHSIKLSLISNVFSGSTGNFIADSVTEEMFVETFHDLLRIQPPDNPLRLSYNDYAIAVVKRVCSFITP